MSKKDREKRYPSIRKALIITVLLALLPALGIITYTGIEQTVDQVQKLHEENIKRVDVLSDFQKQLTDNIRQVQYTISVLPGFVDWDTGHMDLILKSLTLKSPDFLNYTAVDVNGLSVASAMLPEETDLSQTEHVKTALKNKRFSAGSFFKDESTGGFSLTGYAYPIFARDGELLGALACSYRLYGLYSKLSSLNLLQDSTATITDHSFRRLVHYPYNESMPVGQRLPIDFQNQILNSPLSGNSQRLVRTVL